jgi:hypothetical protein
MVGEVRRRVAGHLHGLEGDPGELERLVALEQRVRRVAARDDARWHEVREVLKQRALAFGHVDGGVGALGEVGDAAEVVPVAVRDQDRGAASAGARELEPSSAASPPGSTTTASVASREARTT